MPTFDDYSYAVRKECDHKKEIDKASILLKPSPAQLRNLCLAHCDNKLNSFDDSIFRAFFQAKPEDDLKKCITNFDVEKFRAIRNFITGSNSKTGLISLNLIAVLVDFQPRPFSLFLKSGNVSQGEKIKPSDKVRNGDFGEETGDNKFSDIIKKVKKLIIKYRYLTMLAFLMVVLATLVLNEVPFSEKQCMQWQENHYEAMDCQAVSKSGTPIVALEEDKLNFRQIYPKKDDPFMKDGQPIVWYSKKDNKVDFFNADGKHPITGKDLGPANFYIMHKYGK